MYIEIEYQSDRVVKRYLPELAPDKNVIDKYFREVAAYEEFKRLEKEYVPRLISFNKREYLLEIEFAGTPLNKWIAETSRTEWEMVINQLLLIDKDLYRSRVNYLYSSPSDVLINVNGQVKIIDFEYTEFNRRYEHLLLSAMIHERLQCAGNKGREFGRIVAKRLPSCYLYLWRRVFYSIHSRLGRLREKTILVAS